MSESRDLPAEPPALGLTRLTPGRRTALEALAGEVLAHYPRGRRTIAVDGVTGSATSAFADDLALALRARDQAVFRAEADDFHLPTAERHRAEPYSAEDHYRGAFDTETLRRVLLDPFRMGGSTGFVLAAFDRERNAPLVQEWTTAPDDAVLVVDGVFLQRPELRGVWNYAIWVDAPVDTDEPPDAQELYRAEADPVRSASAIIDLRDPDAPRRTFRDSC